MILQTKRSFGDKIKHNQKYHIDTVWTVNDVLSWSTPFFSKGCGSTQKGMDQLKTSLTVHTVQWDWRYALLFLGTNLLAPFLQIFWHCVDHLLHPVSYLFHSFEREPLKLNWCHIPRGFVQVGIPNFIYFSKKSIFLPFLIVNLL